MTSAASDFGASQFCLNLRMFGPGPTSCLGDATPLAGLAFAWSQSAEGSKVAFLKVYVDP